MVWYIFVLFLAAPLYEAQTASVLIDYRLSVQQVSIWYKFHLLKCANLRLLSKYAFKEMFGLVVLLEEIAVKAEAGLGPCRAIKLLPRSEIGSEPDK